MWSPDGSSHLSVPGSPRQIFHLWQHRLQQRQEFLLHPLPRLQHLLVAERLGPRFPDMTHAYFGPYRKLALEQGRRLGIAMHEGVYAAVLGPSYETPAEIRYLRTIGADLVGMSTVAEVIAARHLGLRVLAISCVTNMAAGILDQPLNHEEVLQTGERVKEKFLALLEAVLPQVEDLAG